MDIIKNKKILGIIVIIAIIIITIIYYNIQSRDSYVEIENNIETLSITKKEEDEIKKIKVHIAGYVVNEGIIEIEEGARIDDVINAARRLNIGCRYNKC